MPNLPENRPKLDTETSRLATMKHAVLGQTGSIGGRHFCGAFLGFLYQHRNGGQLFARPKTTSSQVSEDGK